MSNQEILEKAIQKAIDGGWNSPYPKFTVYVPRLNWIEFNNLPKANHVSMEPYTLIFNHDFAKALFGEKTERLWECPLCGYSFEYYKHNETQQYCPNDRRKVKDVTKPVDKYSQPWLKHLQDMVAEDDPIRYLGYFFDGTV